MSTINKRLCKPWKFPSLLSGVVIKWDLGAIVASLTDKTQKRNLEQLAWSFSATFYFTFKWTCRGDLKL